MRWFWCNYRWFIKYIILKFDLSSEEGVIKFVCIKFCWGENWVIKLEYRYGKMEVFN